MIFYKASLVKKGSAKLENTKDILEYSFLRRPSFSMYRGYLKRGCWRMGDNEPYYYQDNIKRRNI